MKTARLDYIPKNPARRRRRQVVSSPTPAPPVALTLVAVEFDPSVSVTLTFDRDIDIASLVAADVSVDDGPESILYRGVGLGTLLTPTTVVIALVEVGGQSALLVTLTAGAESGIVAVDDGGTWAGTSELELPFP